MEKELLMRTISVLAVLLGATAASAHMQAKVVTQNEFKVGAKPTIVVDSAAGGVEIEAGFPEEIARRRGGRVAGTEEDVLAIWQPWRIQIRRRSKEFPAKP